MSRSIWKIEVIDALRSRLEKTTIGDPAQKETRMGPLASSLQAERFEEQLQQLSEITETVYMANGMSKTDAFTNPRVLVCHKPLQVDEVHCLEAFGPMTTVMPYKYYYRRPSISPTRQTVH
ncbi:MAG: aldehyde dehydrogenase family protein [Planctomycetota bacterium]|nr:aldehyde dehydrogenase family protein [Planctomycetota bacterium]